jgi:hypothetical protein
MTTKDYVKAIELMVRDNPSHMEYLHVTEFLIKFFQEDNPEFNKSTFVNVAYWGYTNSLKN